MPTQAEYEVAVDSLRKEADIWTNQAHEMSAIAAKVGQLGHSRLEAGIFQMSVQVYQQLTEYYIGRCQEGSKAMDGIGQTLRVVADNYAKENLRATANYRQVHP